MAAVHAVVGAQRCDEGLLEAVVGVVRPDHRAQEREHRLAVLVEEALKRRRGRPVTSGQGGGAHCSITERSDKRIREEDRPQGEGRTFDREVSACAKWIVGVVTLAAAAGTATMAMSVFGGGRSRAPATTSSRSR